MTWNSQWPVGNVSVKDNRATGQQNTTYIKTNLGGTANDLPYDVATKDHFWDQGADLSGHHRFFKAPGFTNGGTPTDPGAPLGTSIDGIMYLKTVNADVARVEMFYRNVQGIYQLSPSFLQGTTGAISGAYVVVDAVPTDCYGEIFMWATVQGTAAQSKYRTVTGFFNSTGGLTKAWALANEVQGEADSKNGLKFANGTDAVGLNILARTADASNGLLWNYRITYRAI